MLLGNMFIEVSACERLGRWQFAMAVMEKMQLQEVNQKWLMLSFYHISDGLSGLTCLLLKEIAH
jgi:hypothetical protein